MIEKIKAFFAHSRTILVARLYTLAGSLVVLWDGLNSFFAGQDFTPISTRVMDAAHVPPDLRPMVVAAAMAATGEVFVYLRKITTQPLDQKPGAG